MPFSLPSTSARGAVSILNNANNHADNGKSAVGAAAPAAAAAFSSSSTTSPGTEDGATSPGGRRRSSTQNGEASSVPPTAASASSMADGAQASDERSSNSRSPDIPTPPSAEGEGGGGSSEASLASSSSLLLAGDASTSTTTGGKRKAPGGRWYGGSESDTPATSVQPSGSEDSGGGNGGGGRGGGADASYDHLVGPRAKRGKLEPASPSSTPTAAAAAAAAPRTAEVEEGGGAVALVDAQAAGVLQAVRRAKRIEAERDAYERQSSAAAAAMAAQRRREVGVDGAGCGGERVGASGAAGGAASRAHDGTTVAADGAEGSPTSRPLGYEQHRHHQHHHRRNLSSSSSSSTRINGSVDGRKRVAAARYGVDNEMDEADRERGGYEDEEEDEEGDEDGDEEEGEDEGEEDDEAEHDGDGDDDDDEREFLRAEKMRRLDSSGRGKPLAPGLEAGREGVSAAAATASSSFSPTPSHNGATTTTAASTMPSASAVSRSLAAAAAAAAAAATGTMAGGVGGGAMGAGRSSAAIVNGKKRYPCQYPGCNKTFSTSGHAARHHRIHTGRKPYRCTFPGCNASFSRQDNSLQHYRTHVLHPKARAAGLAAGHLDPLTADPTLLDLDPETEASVRLGRKALEDGTAIAVVHEVYDRHGRRGEAVQRTVGQPRGSNASSTAAAAAAAVASVAHHGYPGQQGPTSLEGGVGGYEARDDAEMYMSPRSSRSVPVHDVAPAPGTSPPGYPRGATPYAGYPPAYWPPPSHHAAPHAYHHHHPYPAPPPHRYSLPHTHSAPVLPSAPRSTTSLSPPLSVATAMGYSPHVSWHMGYSPPPPAPAVAAYPGYAPGRRPSLSQVPPYPSAAATAASAVPPPHGPPSYAASWSGHERHPSNGSIASSHARQTYPTDVPNGHGHGAAAMVGVEQAHAPYRHAEEEAYASPDSRRGVVGGGTAAAAAAAAGRTTSATDYANHRREPSRNPSRAAIDLSFGRHLGQGGGGGGGGDAGGGGGTAPSESVSSGDSKEVARLDGDAGGGNGVGLNEARGAPSRFGLHHRPRSLVEAPSLLQRGHVATLQHGGAGTAAAAAAAAAAGGAPAALSSSSSSQRSLPDIASALSLLSPPVQPATGGSPGSLGRGGGATTTAALPSLRADLTSPTSLVRGAGEGGRDGLRQLEMPNPPTGKTAPAGGAAAKLANTPSSPPLLATPSSSSATAAAAAAKAGGGYPSLSQLPYSSDRSTTRGEPTPNPHHRSGGVGWSHGHDGRSHAPGGGEDRAALNLVKRRPLPASHRHQAQQREKHHLAYPARRHGGMGATAASMVAARNVDEAPIRLAPIRNGDGVGGGGGGGGVGAADR